MLPKPKCSKGGIQTTDYICSSSRKDFESFRLTSNKMRLSPSAFLEREDSVLERIQLHEDSELDTKFGKSCVTQGEPTGLLFDPIIQIKQREDDVAMVVTCEKNALPIESVTLMENLRHMEDALVVAESKMVTTNVSYYGVTNSWNPGSLTRSN